VRVRACVRVCRTAGKEKRGRVHGGYHELKADGARRLLQFGCPPA
jgi:hypothetical protein